MADYRVIFKNMPTTVKSFVHEDADGYGTIVVNARLSSRTQRKCCEHEEKHLEREDFLKADVDEIETEAHKTAPRSAKA